jgi:septal ring factor EnvC (AmiA/AmiB activator)
LIKKNEKEKGKVVKKRVKQEDELKKTEKKVQKVVEENKKTVEEYNALQKEIEKAKEVHVVNSSFMNLIDCIQLRNDNLFYHEYEH